MWLVLKVFTKLSLVVAQSQKGHPIRIEFSNNVAVNSTLQVFMVFSIKFMTSSDILYILRLF